MSDAGLIDRTVLRRALERYYLQHRALHPNEPHDETVAVIHRFICGRLDQSKSDALKLLREIKAYFEIVGGYEALCMATFPERLKSETFEEKMLWLINFHEGVLRECGTDDINLLRKKDF